MARVWVIHSGKERKAHLFFLTGHIALSWHRLRDLSSLEESRAAFKGEYRRCYGHHAASDIEQGAGCLYRFVHKMEREDFVIYPSGPDCLVRVGRVTRGYQYRPALNSEFPHVRRVRWLDTVPRKNLTTEVKEAISGRNPLYEPHQHLDELRAALLP